MVLKSVILKNFRSYKEKTVIEFDSDITAFIGKNDAGKSSILDALEIFFNSENVKPESEDRNINATDDVFSISCIFDDIQDSIILDESAKTTFNEEYLLNSDGYLEIEKRYKGNSKITVSTFIIANYPQSDKYSELHLEKIQELKRIAKALGVGCDGDERISSNWRKAIWSSSPVVLNKTEIEITKASDDLKNITEKINELMPVFALFKSDRTSNDGDPEAKNPIQTAVKVAQKQYENEIQALKDKINTSVMDVAMRTLDKLREMDPALADQLNPKLKDEPKWTFNYTLDGDNDIPINKRGSGFRRLVLLNFFRAEAEKKKAEGNKQSIIYAIEEPETSQHPNYQRMLIESLINLGIMKNCQVIITTHVPALAGLLPINGVRYITKDDIGSTIVENVSDDVLEKVVESLGILPESIAFTSSAAILVEGHSDITFLNHISSRMKELNKISQTLEERKIGIIPIGGCGNINHWVNKKILDKLGIR
jgi:predicted ATP-dependent endonuclease of OLD family